MNESIPREEPGRPRLQSICKSESGSSVGRGGRAGAMGLHAGESCVGSEQRGWTSPGQPPPRASRVGTDTPAPLAVPLCATENLPPLGAAGRSRQSSRLQHLLGAHRSRQLGRRWASHASAGWQGQWVWHRPPVTLVLKHSTQLTVPGGTEQHTGAKPFTNSHLPPKE